MALQQSANEKLRLFNAFSKDEFVQIVEHIVVKWINEQPMNLVEKLSERLEIETDIMVHSIETLCFFFLQICKINPVYKEYAEIFSQTGMSEAFEEPFFQIVSERKDEIRESLREGVQENFKHFKDLNWRLDVCLANHFRQNIMTPKFTMNLSLKDEKNIILQSDYTNMKRIADELKLAISALKLPYSKKVLKFMK